MPSLRIRRLSIVKISVLPWKCHFFSCAKLAYKLEKKTYCDMRGFFQHLKECYERGAGNLFPIVPKDWMKSKGWILQGEEGQLRYKRLLMATTVCKEHGCLMISELCILRPLQVKVGRPEFGMLGRKLLNLVGDDTTS